MTNYPVEMYNYHAWATQTIIGRLKELPSSVLNQEVNSSFPTVAHALNHIYAVDIMWYQVLTGVSMREALQACYSINDSILSSSDEYADIFARSAEQYKLWFQSRSEKDLEQTIILDNPYAGIRETRLSEIVLHTVNHGTYHRGNISTMLRQLGHASTMNDYALFWYRQPADVI
ncbi:DinB family protein [Paenibacillus sp. NEAU-GSW1]|uniref:DinB family protein n=1 Tax=Paenibacillus sp. NEAU-GSW1 TaxID=2682486 RepID=UPI0012E2FA28|nr:DinB family protein [Paenibacillus sp. NEAU-GSW1]MUT68813.1 damage-inducible protein DinB [Paenibacillus sp. NEAU-GSW1]